MLLCWSRRVQNKESVVNKTEGFFRTPQQTLPSLPPAPPLIPPPFVTRCFLPAIFVLKCEEGDIIASSCKQVWWDSASGCCLYFTSCTFTPSLSNRGGGGGYRWVPTLHPSTNCTISPTLAAEQKDRAVFGTNLWPWPFIIFIIWNFSLSGSEALTILNQSVFIFKAL